MKKETYLAWLPCEARGCFGIYDGCIEPQSKGQKLAAYLKQLLEKAGATSVESDTWEIDAGTWYFGAEALAKIKAEIEQN